MYHLTFYLESHQMVGQIIPKHLHGWNETSVLVVLPKLKRRVHGGCCSLTAISRTSTRFSSCVAWIIALFQSAYRLRPHTSLSPLMYRYSVPLRKRTPMLYSDDTIPVQ